MSPIQKFATDDVRIKEIKALRPPSDFLETLQASQKAVDNIVATRADIHQVLHNADDRLLVIIGPCSIHDEEAGIAYAKRLLEQRSVYAKE